MADGTWIGGGAGLERIVFDLTGGDVSVMGANFGVGTPAPACLEHIQQSATGYAGIYAHTILLVEENDHTGIEIMTPIDKQGSLLFSDAAAASRGYVIYDHSSDNLYLGTDNTVRITVLSTGEVGISTTPDRFLHAEVSDAYNAAVTWAQRLTHVLSTGTAVAGFGVGIEFELETATSQDVAGRLLVEWHDAVHASRMAMFGIDLNYAGNIIEACRIVASDTIGVGAGNARGHGAVDFGATRDAATDVASGEFSVISGGRGNEAGGDKSTVSGGFSGTASGVSATVGGGTLNTASSDYATVAGGYYNQATTNIGATIGGGQDNVATGQFSAIPGGYRGKADKYGQICSAAGYFAAAGDAQGTIQAVQREVETHNDASWRMFGAGTTLTIAVDTVWAFSALITGTTQGCTKSFGFKIEGVVENDGGTTTLLNSTVTTLYDGDDVSFDARASASDAADALIFEVQDADGTGDTVRWVVTVEMAEVSFPA